MFHSPFNATLLDVPRPHLDPISTLQEALAVVALAARRPLRDEAVLLQLDDRRRGIALSNLGPSCDARSGAHDSMVRRAVSRCGESAGTAQAFVVSFRRASLIGLHDVPRLHQLSHALSLAGLALLDWVVVGRGGFYCPRVLTDAPDPWSWQSPPR